MHSIGFIGVGDLAEYTIRGLRLGGFEGLIYLSPRNRKRSDLLAKTLDCKVQNSNQAVVDHCECLVLSTRPDNCLDALSELKLKPDQILVSVVAGVGINMLRNVVGSDKQIVRAMPVNCAEAVASPTIIFPHNADVAKLFDYCGQAITVPDESAFNQGSVLACVYTWYFELFEQLIKSTAGKELPTELASQLVLGMAKGAASLALQDKSRTPGEIATCIATEGTYSRLGLDLLKDRSAFEPWQQACRLLIDKLSQKDDAG
jgi:pyrroline-5-carboxylate reductase